MIESSTDPPIAAGPTLTVARSGSLKITGPTHIQRMTVDHNFSRSSVGHALPANQHSCSGAAEGLV